MEGRVKHSYMDRWRLTRDGCLNQILIKKPYLFSMAPPHLAPGSSSQQASRFAHALAAQFMKSNNCRRVQHSINVFREKKFSPSYSSQSYHEKPIPRKNFFKSEVKDGLINHLCLENRFKEAIDALCEQKRLTEAIQLLDRIGQPSALVYSTLVQSCTKQHDIDLGKRVHNHMKRSGFVPGIVISNRILAMYAKCDSMIDAQKLFDEMSVRDLCSWNTMIDGYAKAGKLVEARRFFDKMPERDHFSWTPMISGYSRAGLPNEALELYRTMHVLGSAKSNKFTVSSALAAVAAIPCLRNGKEIHGHIIRCGLDSDEVVWSSLSDMYGKCGSIKDARYVFDKMKDRDIVTWTAMIDRYFSNGRVEEGFALFSELIKSNMMPNEFTFAGVLNACANHAIEDLGKQVHGYMTRVGFNLLVSFAASALVSMYSKCGNMENARKVFEGMSKPDLVIWTSLIGGYAQNGQPKEALRFFDLMISSGITPDHVSFVGVLSACKHAGLVDKGLEYFHSINEKYSLTHTADHYACIVDLLARAGRFKEAKEIIDQMQMKPDRFLWASLLGGCRIHGNLELAKEAAEALFEIEPENPATYITIANICATAGLWSEVEGIRKAMEKRGVVKMPGKSWIEIERKRHEFLVGDTSHPEWDKINEFLIEISRKMKEEGYVPDTNFVLHDVEEEQKEQNLVYHSEKLAVAYGIISTVDGTHIKVYKNLRTCVDCHNAIKFMSRIAKRKITVRDSNRFHFFEDGVCSCKDFW